MDKALKILDAFTYGQPELSLAQLNRMLKIPKTTLFNHICTLERAGFLYKVNNTQNYRLGYKLMELNYFAHSSLPIMPYAVPLMEELCSTFDENVYLTTHIDGRVLYLKCLHANVHSIAYSVSGKTLPMHCTSCGKAMLSYMPHEEVVRILETHGMPAITQKTHTDFDSFMEELALCRERGYATDDEEESIGGRCVAVAVRTPIGNVAGALSISGSVMSMTDDKVSGCANTLLEACHVLMPHAHLFPAIQLQKG